MYTTSVKRKTLLTYTKQILQGEIELEKGGKYRRTMNQPQQASN